MNRHRRPGVGANIVALGFFLAIIAIVSLLGTAAYLLAFGEGL